MHIRDIASYFEPSEECIKFIAWAFGEKYEDLSLRTAFDRWNEKHSEKLLLNLDGCPEHDIAKMIAIWRKEISKISFGKDINISEPKITCELNRELIKEMILQLLNDACIYPGSERQAYDFEDENGDKEIFIKKWIDEYLDKKEQEKE